MKKLAILGLMVAIIGAFLLNIPHETPIQEKPKQEEIPVIAQSKEFEQRPTEFQSVFQINNENIVLNQSQDLDKITLDISWWENVEETLTLSTDQLMLLKGDEYRFHFYFYSDMVEAITIRWGDESGTIDQSVVMLNQGEGYFDKSYVHQKEDTYTGWISVEFHRNESNTSGVVLMNEFSLNSVNKQNHSIKVNQLGYLPNSQKIAIFQYNAGDIFHVIDTATNHIVYSGQIMNQKQNEETGEINGYGDFSSLQEPGSYRVVSQVNGRSYDFVIDEHRYDELGQAVLHMITLQRCGQELTQDIAGMFAHLSCHDDNATIYSGGARKDMTGGWHDAGDYGRYTLTTVKTVNDLLLSYWLFPESIGDANQSPDSGNGVSDVLDEALYGLKWLKKMQQDWGPVYTAAVTESFAGFVTPEKDRQPIYVLDEENTTTAAVSGTFALASLILRSTEPGKADELLADAIKAYDNIDKTDSAEDKRNPWNISAGDYSNESVLDELFFAASALYTVTHEPQYLEQITKTVNENPELLFGFSYSDLGGYGTFLLLQDETFKQEALYKTVYDLFMNHVSGLISQQVNNGYQVVTNGYYWGGNMHVANNGMAMLLANKIAPSEDLVHGAQEQLSYMLGKNSLNQSFITGFGNKYPRNIHHRITESLNIELPGALVGGPDANVESSRPIAKKYWDESELYSTNEVTIYYNSPLVFLLSGLK